MYCIIQLTTHNKQKFSSTLWHCKAKSALQINPSNTNNSASVEPISKYWRKNNYNTFQSTQYNQRVLRPRSASNPTLSEITFTRVVSGVVSNHLSLFVSLFVSLLRSSERVYIDKCHMTTNLLVYAGLNSIFVMKNATLECARIKTFFP